MRYCRLCCPRDLVMPVWWRLIVALVVGSGCAAHRVAAAEDVDFTRDVRPILSRYCFKCHGPDEKKREAALRFDVRDGAVKAAESGALAIVPNEPDKSELIHRVLSKDADEVMPPPATKDALSAAQKETLRRWIAAG